MSLKAKLISSISAFVLVLTILIVSVWAVSQTQIPIGGTVNFKATNVHAEVSGTVTGMEDNPTLPTLIFSEGEDASSEEDLSPWKNLNLLFTELGEPIKITVTVKNLSDERSLGVSVTNQMDPIENVNISITKGEGEASTSAIVSPSSSTTFVLTISVEDINVSVKDALYKFLINLTDASQMREINVHSNYPENITLSGGGMYAVGDTVTITASPDDLHRVLYIASDPNFENVIDVNQNTPFTSSELQPYSYTFTLEEDSLTDYYFVAANSSEDALGNTIKLYVEGHGEFMPDSGQPYPQETGNFYYILTDAKIALYFGLYAASSEEENLAITSVTAAEEVVIDDVAYPVFGIVEGDSAFIRNFPNATKIILPSSIKVVWGNIFHGINIKNLQFAGNEFLRYDEEHKVFLNDENVIVGVFANSTVPEEATGTVEDAFRMFGGTELVFGSSFKSLGEGAFINSKNLTTITFEGALEEIGERAFYGCDNLTTIVLGAGSTANQTFEEVRLSGTWTKDGSIVTGFSGEGNYVKPIKSYSGVNYTVPSPGQKEEVNLEFNIFSDMTAQFKMSGYNNGTGEVAQIIARGEVEMNNSGARITKPTYLYAEGIGGEGPILWQEGDSESLENTAYLYALTYTQAMMIMDKVIYFGELSCFVDGYEPAGTDDIIGASFGPALELTGEETLSEIFEGSDKPSLGIFFDRYENYEEFGDEVDCNFQPKNLKIISFDGKPYDGATKVTFGLHTVEVSFQLEEGGETLTTTALFNASNLPNVIL